MRPEEASWIGRILASSDLTGRTVMNVGSSTGRFREVTQPHIELEIFAPLMARGVRVIHADMKAAEGVDLVGDLLDPAFRRQVVAIAPDVVLANNLFEHVRDRHVLADCLADLPGEDGRLIVSVPRAYPYHADPIDTMYRPTPGEIAGMFPGFTLEDQAVVESTTLWQDLNRQVGRAGAVMDVLRRVARLAVPFIRPRAWLGTASGLVWMWRKRSVSIASLRRRSGADGAAG